MKQILIVGSGISGLTCAVEAARAGLQVILAAPYPSERAQSVMAAGGINAALDNQGEGDSIASHVEDTMKGGCWIADEAAVAGLCTDAPAIIQWLERLGVLFARNQKGMVDQRAFGGQSHRRTCYAGASTGKQIVTALVREARKYECQGRIQRRLGLEFHSALLSEGCCYGAVLYDTGTRRLEPIYADAVVMATGGQNALFGKTTGSALCDGAAAGMLFLQGVALKNLEFIQYHPTTMETAQKRMLITEAARGEGGRLYYLDGDRRVYFMEDAFGPMGNLMPRDIVAKHIYDAPSQVYLDIAFLGKEKIAQRLPEVQDLCRRYAGLDVTRESIPVAPAVHFFMGGLAVDRNHRTNMERLYAIGECASIYHGANRLGGNSLLAAVHSGRVAAAAACELSPVERWPDFQADLADWSRDIQTRLESNSRFSAMYVRQEVASLMNRDLGITRTEKKLREGIESVDYYLSVCDRLIYDSELTPYQSYTLRPLLTLARGILTSALERRETRGAHIREDFPESRPEFQCASIARYDGGRYHIEFVKEGSPCG